MMRAGLIGAMALLVATAVHGQGTPPDADDEPDEVVSAPEPEPPSLRPVMIDLQRSEQLIAAAIRVGDAEELRRQGFVISKIGGRMPNREPGMLDRIECAGAVGMLLGLTDDARPPATAQKVLAAERSLQAYRSSMTTCESKIGLAAPRQPNLR